MNDLTDQQLATLRRLLAMRRKSLQSALREAGAPGPEGLASMAADSAEQTDTGQQGEHENDALARDLRELRDIEAAQERIVSGHADVCSDCGEPIGFKRLLVQPTAIRCVACQALSEQADRPLAGAERGAAAMRR